MHINARTTLVAALTVVLSAVVWAADNRTILKPGWNMFSTQQDIEVGQQVSVDAERQLPMLNNARLDTYVNTLGRRLAAKAPGEKYPYRFKVVNDKTINAFALPGGPIYVNRGVIEAADNEAELAGVLAHEISHVALRHGTNQASKASAAQLPLAILGGVLGSDSTKGALAQLGASFALNSILLKYSRTAETQADVMGTQILHDAGYDARAMAQFFQKIEAEAQGGDAVQFFSNHPNPGNRIERVNGELNLLGEPQRAAITTSREFEDATRNLRALAGPPAKGQLASNGSPQPISGGLRIVTANYGAGDRFVDVRQRLQSRVKDDQLDIQIDNASMGGDPDRNRAKTLRVRYEWAGRQYDATVAEDHWLTLPTDQQIREGTIGTGSTIAYPSARFVNAENTQLLIGHPDNWKARGQGDAMTITPQGGLINDGQGNQALAYGVIINIFEPAGDTYGQQLQSRNFGQASAQNAAARLEEATDRLVQELRLSNRNMRVIRNREAIQVGGSRALSTYLSNDSPAGGRETDWLVTMAHADGLLFIVFTAPEREAQIYEGTFHQMLRSLRIKQ